MKTFDIEPELKPDMSNYLIHMTGKSSIQSILKDGRNSKEGLIKAQIPKGSKGDNFKYKIACFTETPIFALGAFIAISKRRSAENMQYGIGFKKSYMVQKKVRPTIYLDNKLLSEILSIANGSNSGKVNQCINEIRALAHPLGETMEKQGFTWEREWRFVDDVGFYFDFDAIEVICCPNDEKLAIMSILGGYCDKIRFIDSWQQYTEYTQYIKNSESKGKISDILGSYDDDKINNFLVNCEEHIKTLTQYKDYLLSLKESAEQVEKEISELVEWKEYIDSHTTSYCGHFSEELIYRADFGETFCPQCSSDFNEGLAKYMSED